MTAILRFRVRAAICATLLFVSAVQARDVFVAPSSHLDLWYLGTPDNSYARFERILSGALDLLEREPDFRFTVENAYYLAQYLRLRPEMHGRLQAAFSSGRLDLSAQWCGLLQNPATAEDLVRNLVLAFDLARTEFHLKPRAVIAEDMPGFTPQMAQLWKRSGVAGAMLTRGGPKDTPVFNWQAPDGSTSRVAYTVGGYASAYFAGLAESIDTAEGKAPVVAFHSVRDKRQEYQSGLVKYLSQNYPGGGPVLLGAGPDLSFPPPHLAEVVREWNRRHGGEIRVHVVTMPGFLDATRADSFPTLSGDLQSVWQPASLTVERHLTLARTSHRLLVAEKLATLASLLTPMRYPGEALDRAWGWHLATLDHEGAAVAEDSGRAEQVAEEIQTQAAQMIADRIRTANRNAMVIAVLNPLGWKRRALVRVALFLHGDIPTDARRWRQIIVRDEEGKAVPARLRDTPAHAVAKTAELSMMLDLPPLGYRAVTLEPADDRTGPEVTPWETPAWKDVDAQHSSIGGASGWQARFDAQTQSVRLSRASRAVACLEVAMQSAALAPVAWKSARWSERWGESALRLEAEQGAVRVSLELRLPENAPPELASEAVFPADLRQRILLRVLPADWSPESVVYGVPFGEMPFGSRVPGSGPTQAGDERPVDVWRTLKEFDGWFRWDSAAGRITMATEARGAHFAADAISFVLAPRSRAVSSEPMQHVGMRASFASGARSERPMWELMEPPVTAVSEDRFAPAPLSGSFSLLDWSAEEIVITALRRRPDGSVVLRSYAHGGHAVPARLRTHWPPASLTELTPVEEPIGEARSDRKFGPWEMQTLRLAFPPAATARR